MGEKVEDYFAVMSVVSQHAESGSYNQSNNQSHFLSTLSQTMMLSESCSQTLFVPENQTNGETVLNYFLSDRDSCFTLPSHSSPDSASDSTSPFSSPLPTSPGDDFQYDMKQYEEFINPFPPLDDTESLDSIIQSLSSDFGTFDGLNFDMSDSPSLKKRKRTELGSELATSTCTSTSTIESISAQISQGKKILLNREQLLQFSSKEFDEYKQKLTSHHILTAEEKDTLKKQRRIIKNREYSQNSRQKKRERVTELEKRIRELEQENQDLKHENQSLKSKLWKVVSAYQRSKGNDTSHSTPTTDSKLTPLYDIFSVGSSTTNKAATVCLFVVLLSFGLLYSWNGPTNNFGHYQHATGRVILSDEATSSRISFWQIIYTVISREQTLTSTPMYVIPKDDVKTCSYDASNIPPQWDDTHVCDYESYLDYHLPHKNSTKTV